MKDKQTNQENFDDTVKLTDQYIQKLKNGIETPEDISNLIFSGYHPDALWYIRFITRASSHSNMSEEYPIEAVNKFQNLIKKHQNFKKAEKEMNTLNRI